MSDLNVWELVREKKMLNIALAAAKSISAIAINISARFRGCRGQSKLARPQDKRDRDKKIQIHSKLSLLPPPSPPPFSRLENNFKGNDNFNTDAQIWFISREPRFRDTIVVVRIISKTRQFQQWGINACGFRPCCSR